MRMTEQEAAQAWCPYSRPVFPRTEDCGYQAGNRDQETDGPMKLWPSVTCLGSRCMAWRWADPEEPAERLEFGTMNKKPDGDGWVCELPDAGREGYMIKSVWTRTYARRGYCGLAGEPGA